MDKLAKKVLELEVNGMKKVAALDKVCEELEVHCSNAEAKLDLLEKRGAAKVGVPVLVDMKKEVVNSKVKKEVDVAQPEAKLKKEDKKEGKP